MDNWVDIQKDAAHVARERRRARELRRSEWWRKALQRGCCFYCGRQVGAERLTMDHRVPVARGGRSTQGNIVPCCEDCNRDKGCLTPVERLLDRLD